MKKILVTGAGGQLATCIEQVAKDLPLYMVFKNIEGLDITKKEDIKTLFEKEQFDYCINCAAYTAVDKAETEQEIAEKVNVLGPQYLAEVCAGFNTTLIHVSTDFVFDGSSSKPYAEEDEAKPVSVYGQTKLDGEKAIQKVLDTYFIIRTSWLYSEFGGNFMKTMVRLGNERDELGVVCDQIGTPTYAMDLAKVIVEFITKDLSVYGIYHYCNEGVASWYDFAKAIFELSELKVDLSPIKSVQYPTPAKRPNFSVLDKTKIKSSLNIEIPHWRDSLSQCLNKIKNYA